MLKRQLGRSKSTPQKGSRSWKLVYASGSSRRAGKQLRENSGAAVNSRGTPRSG
jgi:hypothetical protein